MIQIERVSDYYPRMKFYDITSGDMLYLKTLFTDISESGFCLMVMYRNRRNYLYKLKDDYWIFDNNSYTNKCKPGYYFLDSINELENLI